MRYYRPDSPLLAHFYPPSSFYPALLAAMRRKNESIHFLLGAGKVLDLGAEGFLDFQVLDGESSDLQSFTQCTSVNKITLISCGLLPFQSYFVGQM
jgi:hypothetical protein